jgi:hypothetical protein
MKSDMDWKEIETALQEIFEKAVRRGDADEALKLTDVMTSMQTKKTEMDRAARIRRETSGPYGDH